MERLNRAPKVARQAVLRADLHLKLAFSSALALCVRADDAATEMLLAVHATLGDVYPACMPSIPQKLAPMRTDSAHDWHVNDS